MPVKIFGFIESHAKALKRVAIERIGRPNDSLEVETVEVKPAPIKSYVLQPIEVIPAATFLNDTLTPGRGLAHILKQNETTRDLEYRKDRSGVKLTRIASNFTFREIRGNPGVAGDDVGENLVDAVQDVFGDFYIVESTFDDFDNDEPCCFEVREFGTPTSLSDAAGGTGVIFDTVSQGASLDSFKLDTVTGEVIVYGEGFLDCLAGLSAEHTSTTIPNAFTAEIQHKPVGGSFTIILGTLRPQRIDFHASSQDLRKASIQTAGQVLIGAVGDRVRIMARRTESTPSVTTILEAGNLLLCPCPGFKFKDSLSDELGGYWPMGGPGSYGAPLIKWPDISSNGFFADELGNIEQVPFDEVDVSVESTNGGSLNVADDLILRGGKDFTIAVEFNIPTDVTADFTLVEKINEYKLEFKEATNTLEWTVNRATTDAVATSIVITRGVKHIAVADFVESTITASVEIDDDATINTGVGTGIYDPDC